MEKTTKIWLTVLILLLCAAMVGIVVFNSRLNDANDALNETQGRLTAAEDALTGVQTELLTAQDELSAKNESISAMESQIAEMQAQIDSALECTDIPEDASAPAGETVEASAYSRETLPELQEKLTAAGDPEDGLYAALTSAYQMMDELDAQIEEQKTAAENADADQLTERACAAILSDARNTAGEALDSILRKADEILTDDQTDAETKAAAIAECRAAAEESIAAMQTATADVAAVAEGKAGLSVLEAELTAANEVIAELQLQISESGATIESLNAQIAALESEGDAADEAQAQLDALNAELAAEQAKVAEQQEQLASVAAQLEKTIAELKAYKISRQLGSGEAYTSTETQNTMNIGADGVTGEWKFTNLTVSGRDVVLELQMDGRTVYTSETIRPGGSIDSITLNEALESGTYSAVAVVKTYDADGAYAGGTRTPVSLVVE